MSEKHTYNQTQFSLEEPFLERSQMPEPEVDLILDEMDEKLKAQAQKRKRMLIISLAVFIILIGFIWLLASFPKVPGGNVIDEDLLSPTITPKELSLRQEIDLLVDQVDRSNRPSQSLVFPPVESEIRIEAR